MSNEHDSLCAEWWSLHPNGGGTLTWRQIGERYGETRDKVKNAATRWAQANGKLGAPSDEEVPSVMQGTLPLHQVEVVDPHVLPETWLDDLWENVKEQARLRQQTEKAETVFTVRVPERLPSMYVWTADWHLCDGGTDHDLFDEDVQIWTTTPGIYLGLGGDYANWFSPAVLSKATPANTVPNDLTKPLVRKKMLAIMEQVLFGIIGNHDEFPGATGWHPVDEILREMGKPNLGPGGNVHIEFGTKDEKWFDTSYLVAARHSFNFNSSVNDTNSMRNLWIQAGCPDIVCTAHLHRPTLHMPTFDGRDTVWIRNGSYKRNDHYAKSKNFQHTRPEAADQPGVILIPQTGEMIPFRNYRHGLHTLAHLREEYTKREAQGE